jgi:hypothetical protein
MRQLRIGEEEKADGELSGSGALALLEDLVTTAAIVRRDVG